jgi:transposase-like protein
MSNELTKTGETKPKRKRPDRKEALSVKTDAGDNSKYLTNALAMWDWQAPDMTSKEDVTSRIKSYFQLCIDDDMKPSVEGLAFAFGVHRKTLWKWVYQNGNRNIPEEVREQLRKAYEVLNVQMANYMQNGKINPVAGIFLMKNNMDYEDKKEITVAPGNPLGEETQPEELRRKYLDAIEVEGTVDKAENE